MNQSESFNENMTVELPLAPDESETNPEFADLKNDYEFDYRIQFKGDKKAMEKESMELMEHINEIKGKGFSDNHPDLIRYRAMRRALYEILDN